MAALSLATSVRGGAFADSFQLLGESDFADGAIVVSDSEWLTAQANENLPTTAIYSELITYFHDVTPGPSGTLTFSLWDLDSAVAGNQVIDFRLDNVPQGITSFETGKPSGSVEFFQFPVPGSALADGMVQVLIQLASPSGDHVGLDFSRLEVLPEPTGLQLLMVLAVLGSRWHGANSRARV
jgi:hypothetical protein